MTTLRALSIRVGELFDLFDESIRYVSEEDKSEVLSRFSLALTTKHGVNKEEIDAGIRMLSMKEAARKGIRNLVATRTVPVSQPEERDQKNGLMWRDVPSTDEHRSMWTDALHR